MIGASHLPFRTPSGSLSSCRRTRTVNGSAVPLRGHPEASASVTVRDPRRRVEPNRSR